MAKYIKDLFLANLTSIEPVPEDKVLLNGNTFFIVDTISNSMRFTDKDLDSISVEDIDEVYHLIDKLSDDEHEDEPNLLHELNQVGLSKQNINKIKISSNADVLFF